MTGTSPESSQPSNPSAPPEGLSAFVARVLNQLSLSAWLPAAFLAASLAVLYTMGERANLDVADAVSRLISDPLQLLVVTVPVVVLTTLVTQSFSFEAIRALEGYWQRRWLLGWLHRLLVSARLKHKTSIRNRLPTCRDRAFDSARGPMLRDKRPPSVVDAVEADLNELPRSELDGVEERLRANTSWRNYGDPSRVAKYDRLRTRLQDYPEDGLIMPTQLGNVLRATEGGLRHTGGDVESFALRRRQLVNVRLQLQHDQFRTRLDMYCILVFVGLTLALTCPVLLRNVPRGTTEETLAWLVPPALFLALAFASYRGAVASARGYCAILRVMDDAPSS